MLYWSFKQCTTEGNKKNVFSFRIVWELWLVFSWRKGLFTISYYFKEFLLLKLK